MSRFLNPYGPRAWAARTKERERRQKEEREALAPPKSEPRCRIQQWSDEMVCATCHLRWDTNDPDPPKCPRTRQQVPESGSHTIEHEHG